jgi:hypothetical protein
MNGQSRTTIYLMLAMAILGSAACSTTTQRIGPSAAALSQHGVGKGDTVLIHYVNKGDRGSSSKSEIVKITDTSKTGVRGIGEGGKAVTVPYEDIFQVGRTVTQSVVRAPYDAPEGAGIAEKVVGNVAYTTLYAFIAAGYVVGSIAGGY